MFLHYRRLNKHGQSLKNTYDILKLLKGVFIKEKVRKSNFRGVTDMFALSVYSEHILRQGYVNSWYGTSFLERKERKGKQ